jgi:outer membrane protein TolC
VVGGSLAGAIFAVSLSAAELTLQKAVDEALRNYPSIRVTEEHINAAAAAIRLAQTAYLPRVDALAQINRATRNTYYGLLLPQNVIPGLDGVNANNLGTVWDSGLGVLVSWQPFDFGLRAARVAIEASAKDRAEAERERSRYEVAVATANAYLTEIAAEQVTQAARAAVDSWKTLGRNIHALVEAQLRPGVDEARLQAEQALAETQVAEAEQAVEVARASVAQFTGEALADVHPTPGKMVTDLPADGTGAPLTVGQNPGAREQSAVVAEEQRKLDAISRQYYPQFTVQGLAAARGTGLETDGRRLGGLNGLAPTEQNYSVGLSVTFPAMDRFAVHEEQAQQSATIRAEQARYQVILKELEGKLNAAQAALVGTRRVAANTPVAVTAARAALDQANARYRSGLAPLDDVAQAQRVLVQAEIDDALARLNVWRALLDVDTARGDIQPFLAEAGQ